MSFKHWLHHLMNPHCPECKDDKECKTCDELRIQLEIERARVNQLLDKVSGSPRIVERVEDENDDEPLKPVSTGRRKFIPFAVRQQMVEANDELTLKKLQDRWKEIHELKPETEKLQANETLENELLETNVLADAQKASNQ